MITNNERWVVVASGPSMLSIDMEQVRRAQPRWRVLVVNCSYELAPWADVLYAADLSWWDAYGHKALFDFPGGKWTWDPTAAVRYRLHRVQRCAGQGLNRLPLCVNSGGNSGFQAVNLAWHFGARQIVLLGFDMSRAHGGHWHPEHPNMISAPARHIDIWKREFDPMAFDLRADGVNVVNASVSTALQCFPRVALSDALLS